MIDTTTAISFIVTFLGGYLIHAKKWWGTKSASEKKDTIKDGIDALRDGKLTADELKALIDEHV